MLPDRWTRTKLLDHVDLPEGQVDPRLHPYRKWPLIAPDHIESESGQLIAVHTAEAQGAISGKYCFRQGDVLYSKIRPYLRKATVARFDGLCSADMYPLRPRSTIDSRFLLMLLLGESFSRFAIAVSMRSGFPKINREELAEFWAELPTIEEQRRIADILDAADATIRLTASVVAKLRKLRAGLLHDLLTRGLDERGSLRNPVGTPEYFKGSPNQVPEAWEVVPVADVGEVRLGRQRSPLHHTGRFTTPYLRVANVFDGFVDYSDVLEMDFTPTERAIYELQKGDILLNEGQSIELVGRSAIYDGSQPGLCFQNTLVRFRCRPGNVPEFCQAVFKYWLDTGRFTQVAKQTTSVAHLGADRFAKMPFPRPNYAEQMRIAERLGSVERRILSEQAYCDKLKLQKRGLMHDLLTGRVRV